MKSYKLWVKYYDGDKAIMSLAEHSYIYLRALIGTPLERSWVTLWSPNEDLIRINLGGLISWCAMEREWTNPLNEPGHYDNPLN